MINFAIYLSLITVCVNNATIIYTYCDNDYSLKKLNVVFQVNKNNIEMCKHDL